jgi:hypothetical protein
MIETQASSRRLTMDYMLRRFDRYLVQVPRHPCHWWLATTQNANGHFCHKSCPRVESPSPVSETLRLDCRRLGCQGIVIWALDHLLQQAGLVSLCYAYNVHQCSLRMTEWSFFIFSCPLFFDVTSRLSVSTTTSRSRARWTKESPGQRGRLGDCF